MPRFTATIDARFETVSVEWSAMADHGAALPFARSAWLEAWTRAKQDDPSSEVLAVTVRNEDGAAIAGLPLVRARAGLRRITFADGDLADYNGPILTRNAPQDHAGAQALWRAVLTVLPPCDVVQFDRMPRRIGDLNNPLTLLDGARPTATTALALDMPQTFHVWLRALPRRYRMELNRCARLFDAFPDASFEQIDVADGRDALATLERLQRDRIAALGHEYRLDGTFERQVYRELVEQIGHGTVLFTVLKRDGAIIAALLGLREKSHYVMLRIGADDRFSNISPARQLIVRTMEMLRSADVTTFDFGRGDYEYKRRLGGQPVELYDFIAGRSLLGLVDVSHRRVKARLRQNHAVRTAVQTLVNLPRRVVGRRVGN